VGGAALTLAAAPAKNGAAPTVPRQYRFVSQTCNACHTDPHQTKLACDTCHTPEEWKQVRPYAHLATSGAKLDGAHQNLKCVQCHKSSGADESGVVKVAPGFNGTPTRCSGCHAAKDAHGGQFQSGPAEDCSSCHVAVSWDGVRYDHDRARFVLSRVHRDVECARCHKDRREVAGKMVRLYRGTSAECVKCH
jgi:predicted CxxxxCH...CXXCH cytochrome family protein